MPLLVRFLIRHAVIGVGLAMVLVALLLGFDVARLGTLVWGSPTGWIAVTALTIALGITLGSVQMGFAVMLLADEAPGPDDEGRGGGHRRALVPAPVRVHAGRGERRARE